MLIVLSGLKQVLSPEFRLSGLPLRLERWFYKGSWLYRLSDTPGRMVRDGWMVTCRQQVFTTVVLICISLINNGWQFQCAWWLLFFCEATVQFFCSFKKLIYRSSFCIFVMNILPVIGIANILSHLWLVLKESTDEQKFLIWRKFNFSVLFLLIGTFYVLLKNCFPVPKSKFQVQAVSYTKFNSRWIADLHVEGKINNKDSFWGKVFHYKFST